MYARCSRQVLAKWEIKELLNQIRIRRSQLETLVQRVGSFAFFQSRVMRSSSLTKYPYLSSNVLTCTPLHYHRKRFACLVTTQATCPNYALSQYIQSSIVYTGATLYASSRCRKHVNIFDMCASLTCGDKSSLRSYHSTSLKKQY